MFIVLPHGPIIDDIDSLNSLCCEISQALGSERTLLRNIYGPSDWHRRMERREECWEGSRELIFEYVIKNEALLEANVTKNNMYTCMFMTKLLCRTVSTVGIRLT